MTFHVMIIPTLNCPSNCKYCWGSENKKEMMDLEIIDEIITWLGDFRDDKVHFTFHGGEPLLAGYDFYKQALEKLSKLPNLEGFSLQSNIWLLNEDLIDLFLEYNVVVSTSIDGPKEINDLIINFVLTVTDYSKDYSDELYDFFKNEKMNLKIHAALPSLRGDNADPWALDQEEHGKLLIDWLDKYLYDLDKFTVMDLDHICKSSLRRRGTLCTFADCIGTTLAVGSDGSIYPCYRFVGMPEYVLGNVKTNPSFDELKQSDAWSKLMEFRDHVDENCKKCRYVKYCEGGCPYNAIVAYQTPKAVDPQCTAYKMIFGEVSKRMNKEFAKSAFGMGAPAPRKEGEAFSIMDLAMKP